MAIYQQSRLPKAGVPGMVGGMLRHMQSFKFHHQFVQYAHKTTKQVIDSADVPGMVVVMMRHMQSLMVNRDCPSQRKAVEKYP